MWDRVELLIFFFPKMGEVGVLIGMILVGRENAVTPESGRILTMMSTCR